MTYFYQDCPQCSTPLEILTYRWDCKTICPKCKTALLVEFDFSVGHDYHEYDFWNLTPYIESQDTYGYNHDEVVCKEEKD